MSFHLLLAHSHCPLGNGCKSLRTTIYLTPVTVLFTSFQIHICPPNLDPASLSENFYPIQNTWERWALSHFTCKHENCSCIKSQLCNLYTFSAYAKAATSKISHYLTRHRCLIIRRCEPTGTYQQRRRCRARDRQIWCVVHTRLPADI